MLLVTLLVIGPAYIAGATTIGGLYTTSTKVNPKLPCTNFKFLVARLFFSKKAISSSKTDRETGAAASKVLAL